MLFEVTALVFLAGGGYALVKWRLRQLEEAITRMADTCLDNRQSCVSGIADQLGELRKEIKNDFAESKEDRLNLRKAVHKIDVDLARLDQKVADRNGHPRGGNV